MLRALLMLSLLPATLVVGHMDAAWWTSMATVNSRSVSSWRPDCASLRGLSAGQTSVCELFHDHMPAVALGAINAIQECQSKFRNHRWNCSTPHESGYIGPIHKMGTREAAFTYAVLAAGVAHEVGRQCRTNQLDGCGCGSTRKTPNGGGRGKSSPSGRRGAAAGGLSADKQHEWEGCSDNVDYGIGFSKSFIDVRENEETMKRSAEQGRALMNQWNNNVGRKLLRQQVGHKCKCHGVSGACNLRTCWYQLLPLASIADHLAAKYRVARRVQINDRGNLQYVEDDAGSEARRHRRRANGNGNGNMLGGKGNGNGRRETSLIYLDDSPDYCRSDRAAGTLGTSGRQCNRDSMDEDGCDALCCGRGFHTIKMETVRKCNCRFQWCCQVVCEMCRNETTVDLCK